MSCENIVGANNVLPGLLTQLGIKEYINCPLMLESLSNMGEIFYFHDGVVVAVYVMRPEKSWWNFSEYGVDLFRPYIVNTVLKVLAEHLAAAPTIDKYGEGLR